LVAAAVVVPGCGLPEGEAAEERLAEEHAGLPETPPIHNAVASLHPASNSGARGVVRFGAAGEDGIRVTSSFTGLEPGSHAYHVHLRGDCSAPDASSAGPHFDFQTPEAEPNESSRILGDLGEIMANDAGLAEHSALLPHADMDRSPGSILGRAVVLHARGNDPDAPPGGDAGMRIACGVIGIAEVGS
jgi:Cu-Zn family superoxide dismutase